VPNLYPAFERQDVVVSVPRHARSLAELEDVELAAIATAWTARARTAREEGFGYVHALVNEGRAAGASLPHSHTQLLWLRESPGLVTGERTGPGDCGVCELLANDAYALAERDDIACLVHRAGRLPYELLIAPLAHESHGLRSPRLASALGLLGASIRALHRIEGPSPLNAWLHDNGHWHLELVPRLTVQAGIELGAGIAVNALSPEDAVRALRESFAG
jgi:UDPglucose--hexose-1-phosphate uridylyltransferase